MNISSLIFIKTRLKIPRKRHIQLNYSSKYFTVSQLQILIRAGGDIEMKTAKN